MALVADGDRAGRARAACTRPASSRASLDGAELPLRYQLEVDYARRRHVHASTTRTASCRRSASSTCTSSARAATRSSRRSSARTARARGRAPAPRSRSGRRTRAPSRWSATSTPGTAGCTRCARSARRASGSCSCPGVGDGRPATSTRSSRRTASSGLKADPVAFAAELPPKTASVVYALELRVGRRATGWRERATSATQLQRARCRSTRSTSARGG